ncbi:MAG TPA: toll/interleukin-1 receptor domain-containing protein, partial [Geodermatophilus sp.]|nr:toll/interleukin-1 receptor domain-containing protein [Geodermatophilus sp.]
MSGRGTDFFISHAGRDTGWAEWLAWQLHQAGYRVELDVWDWAPGEDFVAHMAAALERADRLLAVCTEAYFASAFGGAELRAAFAQSPTAQGRIVPVLVEPGGEPGELAGDEHRLFGVDPPHQVVVGGEPVRVLQGQLGLAHPAQPVERLHHQRGLAGVQPPAQLGEHAVPAGEPGIARRYLPHPRQSAGESRLSRRRGSLSGERR